MQHKFLISCLVVAGFVANSAMARELRCADVQPADHPTVQTVKRISETVSKRTDGKLTIKILPNSIAGSEQESIEELKSGLLDMVRVNTSAFHASVPETMVPSFPFIFRDIQHFRKTMYGSAGNKILAALERSGYVGLILMEGGARSIYSKRPVRSLSDAKGMKIRVQQSDLMMSLVQAMGATPVPIPIAEVNVALKTGSVDAAENNYPTFEKTGHYQTATYYSETQHVMSPDVLIVSRKTWDSLSRDEQKILRDAAKDALPFYTEQWGKQETASQNAVRKANVQIVSDVKKDEFVRAMKPVWDKFSTKPEIKALVQEIVSQH